MTASLDIVLKSMVIGCLMLLLFATIASYLPRLNWSVWKSGVQVTSQFIKADQHKPSKTLYVYVHGMGGEKNWGHVREALIPSGDILFIQHHSKLYSNADPQTISDDVSELIEQHFKHKLSKNEGYEHIVLVGHSMGALLIKRAYLDSKRQHQHWQAKVGRIVLTAGMNRGWDISGQKPSDMGRMRWAGLWLGTWGARLLGVGELILSIETGSPFVANLRMDWIREMSGEPGNELQVIQLLGDIDDLVSAEDNKDLRATGKEQFVWLKVRGTGHGDIINFSEQLLKPGGFDFGNYRKQKFLLAVAGPFDEVKRSNEVLPSQPDLSVSHIVFVIHGIRDLGEWAAAFEQGLQEQFRRVTKGDSKPASAVTNRQGLQEPGSQTTGGFKDKKLAVASIRYGYFGMGPFLLKPNREKYVKWLMDEYTEMIALYPEATNVSFMGHSNGSYLIAKALENYSSFKFTRIVFAGSVVERDYDWQCILQQRAVFSNADSTSTKDLTASCDADSNLRQDRDNICTINSNSPCVINYAAANDLVVALLPRFFEVTPIPNDIGSAGYLGFNELNLPTQVRNQFVKTGGHAAFGNHIEDISRFLVTGTPPEANPTPFTQPPTPLKKAKALAMKVAAWLVIPTIVFVVLLVGWRVVSITSEPRWPILLVYSGLLLAFLRFH